MAAPDPAAFEEALFALHDAAAAVILPLFRADHGLENKTRPGDAAFDPVTAADRGAEAAIRREIAARFPTHGVIGEEHGEDRPDAEFVWVLDPIDGTRAFIAGLPLWTTLIALRHEARPILGGVGQCFLGELYFGHARGAWRLAGGERQPLRARQNVALARALIATTDPEACFDAEERRAWRALRAAARLARLGCDAYAYAMVAAGTLDLVAESGLKCWDIEAAIPLIAGAGGVTADWSGEPIGPRGGQVILAGSRALLDEALPHLAPAARAAP